MVLILLVDNWSDIAPKLGVKPEARIFWQASALLQVFCWFLGAYLADRVLKRFFWDGAVARAIQRPVPGVLKEMGTVVVYIIASACIAGFVFGQSIAAFLATLGAGGVVLGFALRNLLADLFTGLAVNFDNNFAIGDWLVVPSSSGSAETVGQVDEIGWRCTRLTCEDGTTIILPNSILGLEKVVNISRPSVLTRYEVAVSIEYSVPVERARRILMAALQAAITREGFSKEKQPAVLISKTGKRGVKYLLRYWMHPWHPHSPNTSRDIVLTLVLQHLQTAGITPAMPKSDVFHAPMPEKHFLGHTPADKVALLSHIPVFEKLDEAELQRLAVEMTRRQLDSGTVLFRRNEEGDSLFILIEGLLEVKVDMDGSGREETVGLLNPGEFFGEMALLTGDPRSATIQAQTMAVVYEINRSTVMPLIEQRPEISETMSRAVAQRQASLEQARSRKSEAEAGEKVESITRQIMVKMKRFFQVRETR